MKGNENLIRHDSVFLILDLIGKTRFIYEIRKKHKLNILLYIFKRKTLFFLKYKRFFQCYFHLLDVKIFINLILKLVKTISKDYIALVIKMKCL